MTLKPTESLIISTRHGTTLVAWARQVITQELNQPLAEDQIRQTAQTLADPAFDSPRATFVTLTQKGQLRGCIGTLTACLPLKDDVRRNALNAAFKDPRFPPLDSSELAEVAIEVSILSTPQPLNYRDGDDLMHKLRPQIDGVIIRQGTASATFLPQVWEQLPRPTDFLDHLCRKAGLAAGCWQEEHLTVATYQVQYFEEKHTAL